MEEERNPVGLCFAMPNQGTLEIHSSMPIDDFEVESDEEIEGVVYRLWWDGSYLPWCIKTKLQATAIAFGCQWGAMEMAKKMRCYSDN